MNDNFALLHQRRQPWLDPNAVQGKFLALSALVHPDRVHNASEEEKSLANREFAQLNAAWQCLRDPKLRLRHLLELERGCVVQQLERLPSTAMDFYFQVGQACQGADRFLASKPASNSPLLQVRFFEEAMAWRAQLEQFQSSLQSKRTEFETQLQSLNTIWETAPEVGNPEREKTLPLQRLEDLYREVSYVGRWSEQIRERLVQLTL